MRPEFFSLEVKKATAIGAPQVCSDLVQKWVQIAGTFSATLSVEATINGNDYFIVQSGIIAAAVVEVPMAVKSVRIETTSYTSGTPTADMSAYNARTDC
jgi:hypothetical protein